MVVDIYSYSRNECVRVFLDGIKLDLPLGTLRCSNTAVHQWPTTCSDHHDDPDVDVSNLH
jgi:hypothetical protein